MVKPKEAGIVFGFCLIALSIILLIGDRWREPNEWYFITGALIPSLIGLWLFGKCR